ncbi:MAG: hypothetical protein M3Q33_14935, partial [Acidobacteriota bacterium]|nr:hypothetical protein [Acidobacteriota bacterium]
MLLKKSALLAILFCFSVSICLAQTRKTTVESSKSVLTQTQAAAEISENEWKMLTDALWVEDWRKSAFLASQMLR